MHFFITGFFSYTKINMQSVDKKLVSIFALCICEGVVRLRKMSICKNVR